ncbi:Hydrogenase isoenzymes formation protein HypE [compost metagenome]
MVVAAPEAEQAVLAALQAHPLGKAAALIGRVTAGRQVRLQGAYGISRLLDLPHAEPLPRIC